jgi:hypothetical protein
MEQIVKKTVNYNYYGYTCPTGYSTYTKTVPNTTTDNTATLDDPLNNLPLKEEDFWVKTT